MQTTPVSVPAASSDPEGKLQDSAVEPELSVASTEYKSVAYGRPVPVYTSKSSGQYSMTGAVSSLTSTVKVWQVATLPELSTDVQTTDVFPIANWLPEAGLHTDDITPASSVAEKENDADAVDAVDATTTLSGDSVE